MRGLLLPAAKPADAGQCGRTSGNEHERARLRDLKTDVQVQLSKSDSWVHAHDAQDNQRNSQQPAVYHASASLGKMSQRSGKKLARQKEQHQLCRISKGEPVSMVAPRLGWDRGGIWQEIRHCSTHLTAPSAVLAAAVVALVLGGAIPASAQVADADRLRHAVEYLLASQSPSGLFQYDFDFLAGRPVEPDNVVRQAGTAYFLSEYYVHSRDERTRHAVEAALTRLAELSLPIGKTPLQSVLEQTRLLSLPVGRYKLRAGLERLGLLYRTSGNGSVISLERRYDTALTGATALALLSELLYYQATADTRFSPMRRAWLNGLLSLRIPGHGFRISPALIDETPFFNGEAWLALAHYVDMFPGDARSASALETLDGYLMTRYASDVSTGFYQWGTMAAARRLKTTSNPKFLAFIRTQARTLLDAPRPSRSRDANTCAEIEGLATAAQVLGTHGGVDGPLLERIEIRLKEEIEKNRTLQIPENSGRISFGNGIHLSSPKLRDFSGAFLESRFRPYTRVDATGHCVSALIKLAQGRKAGLGPRTGGERAD